MDLNTDHFLSLAHMVLKSNEVALDLEDEELTAPSIASEIASIQKAVSDAQRVLNQSGLVTDDTPVAKQEILKDLSKILGGLRGVIGNLEEHQKLVANEVAEGNHRIEQLVQEVAGLTRAVVGVRPARESVYEQGELDTVISMLSRCPEGEWLKAAQRFLEDSPVLALRIMGSEQRPESVELPLEMWREGIRRAVEQQPQSFYQSFIYGDSGPLEAATGARYGLGEEECSLLFNQLLEVSPRAAWALLHSGPRTIRSTAIQPYPSDGHRGSGGGEYPEDILDSETNRHRVARAALRLDSVFARHLLDYHVPMGPWVEAGDWVRIFRLRRADGIHVLLHFLEEHPAPDGTRITHDELVDLLADEMLDRNMRTMLITHLTPLGGETQVPQSSAPHPPLR